MSITFSERRRAAVAEERAERQRRRDQVVRRLQWASPSGVSVPDLARRLGWPGGQVGLRAVLRELADQERAHVRDDGRWYLGPAPEAREKGCEGGASDASPGGGAPPVPGTPQEPGPADLPAGESGAGSGGLAPEPEGPRAEEQDEGLRAIAAEGQLESRLHPRGRQDEDPSLPTPAPAPVPVQQAGEGPAVAPTPPVEPRSPGPAVGELQAVVDALSPTRRQVYDDLAAHPWSRQRDVCARLRGRPKGTVSSALNDLRAAKVVVRHDELPLYAIAGTPLPADGEARELYGEPRPHVAGDPAERDGLLRRNERLEHELKAALEERDHLTEQLEAARELLVQDRLRNADQVDQDLPRMVDALLDALGAPAGSRAWRLGWAEGAHARTATGQ